MSRNSHIYYGEKQLPLILDLLEEEHPLKYRKLYLEHGEQMQHTDVRISRSGNVHLEVAPLSPVALVTLLGVYAYTLALILDYRKQLPKKPTSKRVNRILEGIMTTLALADDSVQVVFARNLEILGSWLKRYEGVRRVQIEEADDRIRPRCYGVLGLPMECGES